MILSFLKGLLGQHTESDYIIVARRYTIPVNKGAVFGQFKVTASSPYEAARKFDTTYTRWTRLDVTKLS